MNDKNDEALLKLTFFAVVGYGFYLTVLAIVEIITTILMVLAIIALVAAGIIAAIWIYRFLNNEYGQERTAREIEKMQAEYEGLRARLPEHMHSVIEEYYRERQHKKFPLWKQRLGSRALYLDIKNQLSSPLTQRYKVMDTQYHAIEKILTDFKNGATYSDSIEKVQNLLAAKKEEYENHYLSVIDDMVGEHLKALAAKEQEVVEKVAERIEKLRREYQSELHGGYDDADALMQREHAIYEVLQILQEYKQGRPNQE